MADICEICIKIIEFREDGANIDYDAYCLCAKCNEKVINHNEKHLRRSFERCVRDIQKIKKEKEKGKCNKK